MVLFAPEGLALWRSPLSRAIHRNRSQAHHRFFQLATVTPAGLPANRTVVFRGFVDQTNRLKMITDRRSEKIDHLTQNNRAEIAWYFTKTREQFRLAGSVETVTDQDVMSVFSEERRRTWQNISDNARLQFVWPDPAIARTSDLGKFSPPAPDPDYPVDNFVLLVFHPMQVDHLELRGNPQNRWLYRQNEVGIWQKLAVNP
ncbi:MAG: pyridoxamine 5'-phosphate oxidase [Limnothrix sp. RL_2_0]|nr:pyridoxamine 5'-phosphate oxidase [Limnothrix sp. RL_2_0]